MAALAILVSLSALLHRQGFQGPFVVDSVSNIEKNRSALSQGSLTNAAKTFPTRAVSMTSFALNERLAGPSPSRYRLTNALLLGVAGIAVLVLIHIILGSPKDATQLPRSHRALIALFCAAAFVAHPLQSFTVLYVVQRMALLACLFYVASLACYIYARQGDYRSRWPWYVATAIFFVVGVLSKEIAITLPVALILAEIAFFSRDAVLTRRRLLIAAPIVGAAIGMFLIVQLMVAAGQGSGFLKTIEDNYRFSGLGLTQVILTQCRMVFAHAANVLWPFGEPIYLLQPVRFSNSLFDPPITVLAVAGIFSWVCAGLYLLRRRPRLGFGALFFLLALIPESLSDPKLLFLPYRGVLPMVGLLVAAADLASLTSQLAGSPKQAKVYAGALIALGVAWTAMACRVTLSQSALWADRPALWARTVAAFPSDTASVEKWPRIVALNSLARALMNHGNNSAAIKRLQDSLQIAPHPQTMSLMGESYIKAGALSEAQVALTTALKLDPNRSEVLNNLGVVYKETGQLDKAIDYFNKALSINPWYSAASNNIAVVLEKKGQLAPAIEQYRKTLAIDPGNASFHNALGGALFRAGRVDEAARQFAQALRLDPKSAQASVNLGNVSVVRGDHEEALGWFSNAVALNPGLAEAHTGMGVALANLGKLREAVEHFKKAARLKPEDASTQRNLEAAEKELSGATSR